MCKREGECFQGDVVPYGLTLSMSCFINACFLISESPTWVIPKKFQKDECSNEPASSARRSAGFPAGWWVGWGSSSWRAAAPQGRIHMTHYLAVRSERTKKGGNGGGSARPYGAPGVKGLLGALCYLSKIKVDDSQVELQPKQSLK